MKRLTVGMTLGAMALLGSSRARAGDVSDTGAPDAATLKEVHRQRLQTEYLLLEDARTTTFGSDFGVEGRLFTLRIPLARWSQDSSANAFAARSFAPAFKAASRFSGASGTSAAAPTQDDVTSELPPFRLTIGSQGGTVNAELGAVETTLGHGALVNRYVNNPRSDFDMTKMGVVLGARAKSVGGSILLGNVLSPGRMMGFNLHGRPLEWIYGTYSNAEPEVAGNVDYYSLLLSALTVGVSGALDTTAANVAMDYGWAGNYNAPPPVPGTAGGLSGEVDVGINHNVLALHAYGNVTALGRNFVESGVGGDGHATSGTRMAGLFGGGATVGARFNIFLEMLKLGGSFEYRLAGPNYTPSYFDRYYEGDRIFGAQFGGPKIAQRTMARHGYQLQLGAQALKFFGMFLEMGDLMQIDPRFGHNDATMRVGAIMHFFGIVSLLGAYVNRGFTDYTHAFSPGQGSMWLGEARLSLAVFSLVARQWRSFDLQPIGGYQAKDGTSVLAEIVIGIL